MPAFLILLGTLFTWIALYQGILAYAVGPPPDRDLMTVSGRIDDVDTPWTRNRFVEATQVKLEVAPTRFVTIAVRQDTMSTASLQALRGRIVTVRFAGGRPRNRWLYDLAMDGRTLVPLDQERARDVAAHRRSLGLMLLNGGIAVVVMLSAAFVRRRHKRRAQQLDPGS